MVYSKTVQQTDLQTDTKSDISTRLCCWLSMFHEQKGSHCCQNLVWTAYMPGASSACPCHCSTILQGCIRCSQVHESARYRPSRCRSCKCRGQNLPFTCNFSKKTGKTLHCKNNTKVNSMYVMQQTRVRLTSINLNSVNHSKVVSWTV